MDDCGLASQHGPVRPKKLIEGGKQWITKASHNPAPVIAIISVLCIPFLFTWVCSYTNAVVYFFSQA